MYCDHIFIISIHIVVRYVHIYIYEYGCCSSIRRAIADCGIARARALS